MSASTELKPDRADLPPPELMGRWERRIVLKRDIFSSVERGVFLSPEGPVEAVLRRTDLVPAWALPLARLLFSNEVRALAVAASVEVGPGLLFQGRRAILRGWIDGLPLHLAGSQVDAAYFRSAKAVLRRIHRAGLCHNDLAKPQNWLRRADGGADLIDFQLAKVFRRRGRLFRIAAYEDLRHLLKQKQRYAPNSLTRQERRILARKSLLTRIWMATGKRLYYTVARRVFRFKDLEGTGLRLARDAPALEAALRQQADIRDAAIVSYWRAGTNSGLYAFVEAAPGTDIARLRSALVRPDQPAPPDLIQRVDALPRDDRGVVRRDILQLVATNQVDSLPALIRGSEHEAAVDKIVIGRLNLSDRNKPRRLRGG